MDFVWPQTLDIIFSAPLFSVFFFSPQNSNLRAVLALSVGLLLPPSLCVAMGLAVVVRYYYCSEVGIQYCSVERILLSSSRGPNNRNLNFS